MKPSPTFWKVPNERGLARSCRPESAKAWADTKTPFTDTLVLASKSMLAVRLAEATAQSARIATADRARERETMIFVVSGFAENPWLFFYRYEVELRCTIVTKQ